MRRTCAPKRANSVRHTGTSPALVPAAADTRPSSGLWPNTWHSDRPRTRCADAGPTCGYWRNSPAHRSARPRAPPAPEPLRRRSESQSCRLAPSPAAPAQEPLRRSTTPGSPLGPPTRCAVARTASSKRCTAAAGSAKYADARTLANSTYPMLRTPSDSLISKSCSGRARADKQVLLR